MPLVRATPVFCGAGGEHQEVGQAMLEIAGAVSWQPNNVRGERQYEKGCGGGVKKEQGNVQAL